ncbi:(d)CMP kinase [Buchnera aphidicola]|uniref:(d)CMP kinase n=1 Tax=Buchnera aphidicola TaxID=9 RepID=UPI0021C3C44C|nr:(d)CMP kinase [Buchnera aphidicola]
MSKIVSQLTIFFKVKNILLYQQKYFRCSPGLIKEERNVGTVIFPNAIIKFFLDANFEHHVYRRKSQLKKQMLY